MVIACHAQHITVEISRTEEESWFLLSYLCQPFIIKNNLWEELSNLGNNFNKTWTLAGDFNDHAPRRNAQGAGYIEMTIPVEISLGLESLHQRLVNEQGWIKDYETLFGVQATVRHLPSLKSDHCPLLISLNGFAPSPIANKPFWFLSVWMTATISTVLWMKMGY
ncbi:LOW QUALITY PROTEIN: hypothetical protein Cgig2_031003 [Carnegiea gigantea]|uniref:Endonuclease/exonuclease/phosphatase domain-containing protein n=1 Tax=Carnegiea gigantea TaxID=171969 RepID=A0A9Q1KJX3_9CARY|nr:LOW QUALITY PROTEIN: hypothetical protein Cgig2_031003 [Carnegiea gigantea]